MTAEELAQWITQSLDGVDPLQASGDWYFFFDPQNGQPVDHHFPFATLITSDAHDAFSNLNRPGVYRLNIGVSKATFASLIGGFAPEGDQPDPNFDYTQLDTFLPHPVYGRMHWLSVLTPSEATVERVRPLLAEAHAIAARRSPGGRGRQ